MIISEPEYHVYIITNKTKTVLYTGVTNNLSQRVIEHYLNRNNVKSFAGRYQCYWLLYYETFKYVNDAIDREKEIKTWSRLKKERLILEFNPEWAPLNKDFFGKWPPENIFHRKDIK